MLFLWLSSGILCTIFSWSGGLNQQCFDNCTCCKDRKCGQNGYFQNACLAGCIDGHRGARCYELCQYENCKTCGGTGNFKVCEECYDGYYLGENNDCTSQCPSNCQSCTSNKMCNGCKEGFYNKNGSTTCPFAYCPANCECTISQGDCVSCKNGFYDTSTSCNKQCPLNCLTCKSEESCNECKSGFHNGYEYDYNMDIQINNCSYACRDTCTQCQSYNNCLRCIKGRYGQTCQEDCSVGCMNKSCSFDSGQCECTTNFTGDKCIECVYGKHGSFCNKTCSKYCKGGKCERTSGYCTEGCKNKNITGNTCNTCIESMFGDLCNRVCSKNCIHRNCERYSGNCTEGCTDNYNGTLCDLCISGKYGENCALDCPVNCASGVCEKTFGTCYHCIGYFQGEKCDECWSGYYMPKCDEPCSKQCSNYECDRITGECIYGCTNGYSGDKCCVKSDHCLECTNSTVCRKCALGFFTNSCNERCPKDCPGACNISTSECSYCQYKRFGQFCEFNCSHSCKFKEGIHEKACAQSDGTCINGCNVGYFGRTCSETCSRFCVGGACKQDDGICINGCDGHQGNRECLLSEAQKDDVDCARETSTIAILGTLFAVSLIIILMLGVCILMKKKRQPALKEQSRQQSDVAYENQMMSTAPPFPKISETNVVSADKTIVYEATNKAYEAEEEYQTISTI